MLTGSTYKEMIIMLFESTYYAIGAWLLISPLMLAMFYTGLKTVVVRLNSESSRIKHFRR